MPTAAAAPIFTGPEAFAHAKRMARYGHRDWLVYRGRDGVLVAERLSIAAVRRALLAKGTTGFFNQIMASSARPWRTGWRRGVSLLYGLKYPSEHQPGPSLQYKF